MPTDPPCRIVDVVMATCLACAAVAGLVAQGATHAVARFALEVTLASVITIWAWDRRRSPAPMLLMLGLCGLIWFQLAPLPDWLLMRMAPISGGAWKIAHAATPRTWGCISIDPSATAAGLRRLLLGAGGLIVARDIAANASIRRALGAMLAGAAVLIWGLGLTFPRDTERDLLLGLFDINGPIQFWVSPIIAPVETAGAANVNTVTVGRWHYLVADGLVGDGFGSFISSNQFAGAMCLTVPFLFAFWLQWASARWPAWIGVAGTMAIGVAAAWTVGARAGSRAGCAALILGWLTFLVLSARGRRWQRTIGIAAIVTAVALLVLAAAAYGFGAGLESIVPEHLRPTVAKLLTDSRSTGIRVGVRMVRASPLTGTGLDTYAEAFSRFVPGRAIIFYAHNDYLQWVAETGLLGGLVALGCLAYLVRCGVVWFRGRQGTERVLAAGAMAAVIGFASHEFFEWNLHLPAIALVASLVAAVAAPGGSRRASAERGTRTPSLSAALQVPARGVITAVVVVAAAVLARDMATERTCVRLRTALAADRLAQRDATQPPPRASMEAAVMAGETASGWDPANADLPLLVGQLQLHLAARAKSVADCEALERRAESSLARARRCRAICWGVPELVPPTPRAP